MASDAVVDDGDRKEQVAALFDDEAVWDADDTDAYLLGVFSELEAAGVNILTLADTGGNSLLHAAALWNRPAVMEALLRRGAALNTTNQSGQTPMDLAMHYGHVDLAQQLRHYGGKHSCEAERDLAIAQRDLARQQVTANSAETQHAVAALRQARQERESLRVERDRLQLMHDTAVAHSRACEDRVKQAEEFVEAATVARDAMKIQVAQLMNEIAGAQAARDNAISGWKAAEKFVAELQLESAASREREEEALAMRNEAMQERELAREMARQAHLDQGLATQNQQVAERERDKAMHELLQAERQLANDQERCRKQLAKVALERRNIQIEIDRQTELLRGDNARLEKAVLTLTVASTRQREEMERGQAAMKTLAAQCERQEDELKTAYSAQSQLEEQVRQLQVERREAYRAWRERMEAKLQQQFSNDVRSVFQAVLATWKALQSCQQRVQTVSLDALTSAGANEQQHELPLTRSCSSEGLSLKQRPHTATNGSAEENEKRVQLPFLHEPSGLDETSVANGSTSPVKSPKPHVTSESAGSGTGSAWNRALPFQAYDREIADGVAIMEPVPQNVSLESATTNLQRQSSFLEKFLSKLADWIVETIRLLSKQIEAQTKMIERKDELIHRFTQHRQENVKKQQAARFRDCSVRPLL